VLFAVWGYHSGFDHSVLKYHLVVALIPVNLLLCVLVYGGQVQGANDSADEATIDRVSARDDVRDVSTPRYVEDHDYVLVGQ
jgi:hypothetical protein